MNRSEPTRAQRIMMGLQTFHEQVMASAAESQRGVRTALAAEGSGGKTSPRSPSRLSGAQRQRLTGVTEKLDVQGWTTAVVLPHLCFPPDQYPSGMGPGSVWTCRCEAAWVAEGVAWDEYPTDPTRTAQPLKPEQWFYVAGGQLPEKDYRAQEPFYDWRPLGPYYVKLYRAFIDNQLNAMGMSTKAPVTWEELG